MTPRLKSKLEDLMDNFAELAQGYYAETCVSPYNLHVSQAYVPPVADGRAPTTFNEGRSAFITTQEGTPEAMQILVLAAIRSKFDWISYVDNTTLRVSAQLIPPTSLSPLDACMALH